MSKQDRQGARTVSELERKYGLRNLGESFAEVMGLVTDARQATDDLEVKLDGEVERIDNEIESVREVIVEVEERITLAVTGGYATKSELELTSDSIKAFVAGEYETKGDADSAYFLLESQISVEKEAILLSVSKDYETKTDAGAAYDDLESKIQVSADSILLSVSSDYETKNDAQTEYARLASQIQASYDSILLSVSLSYASKDDLSGFASESYIDGLLALKVGIDDNDQIVSMLNASASVISLTSNRLVIDSDNFSLKADGTVVCDGITARNGEFSGTFTNSNGLGTLEISGAMVSAAQSDTTNSSFSLWAGHLNLTNGSWDITYGPNGFSIGSFECNASYSDGSVAFVGTDNYIRFAPEQANLAGTWTSDAAVAVTSDADKKHEIRDITEAYGVIFDNLKPRLYKYNDGTSNRIHVGFIAQEVEAAILAAGLTTQDFAAFVRAEVPNVETGETETVCMLRYEEFIALNTLEIQKLKAKEN